MSDPNRPWARSIVDAATYTSCCRSKIYELLAAGHLVAVKAGRRTLITQESLDNFLSSLPRAVIRSSKSV